MSTLALQRAPDLARLPRGSPPPPAAILAQRRSTFGPEGSIAAPPIVDAGHPLDAATRTSMETGFGHDFVNVRVHDDARAHDNARTLGARAYAAGDHIVFGEGAYRPGTTSGNALIAHELAHSVQQGGVQMKAEGPLPAAADAELEAQADRAAMAVTAGRAAPALTRIGAPAVFRNPLAQPPPSAPAATPAAGPSQMLPIGMTVIADDPPGIGTTELVVGIPSFTLPLEKGIGDWVQKAHTEAGNGGRLVFSPLIEGGKVAAFKEGGEDYKSIWLGNFGFTTTQGLSAGFRTAAKTNEEVKTALADKAVGTLITGMNSGLLAAGCDIDHIVEKQMGGTSIPSNLQLLTSKKNQDSGRQTYQALVDLVNTIRDPNMRGVGVKRLQLQIKSATVPAGTTDPSFIVEGLLRKGLVKGTDAVKAAAQGKPVSLSAGGVGETVDVKDKGKSIIDDAARRIVPGMRLTAYERGPQGAASKTDKVEGELDSRAITKTGASDPESLVKLTATLAPAGTAVGAAAGGDAATANAAAGEVRKLAIPSGPKKIKFFYPYLSPGFLTAVGVDDKGNLTGTGIIKPSVAFLGDLSIRYGPDLLELIAPIDASKMKVPIPGFRFTEGQFGIQLAPAFVPSGNVKFEIGPKGKPILLGDITAKYAGGAFVATGTLTPGAKIPGISEASGTVEYHSEKGWSGKLTAKSSSLPGASQVTAELGFTEKGAFGTGGITARIKDADLFLKIAWSGNAVSYSGGVTILKPLPLVDRVEMKGGYANDALWLTGDAAMKWKSFAATMTVNYVRKDGEEGKFSGKAGIDIRTEKASGKLDLSFNAAGHYWGKGSISYQVTKDIRPTLGVELTPDRRVKVFGEAALADIPLTKMWPSPEGGKKQLIKAGVKFNVPTPVPAVTAYGEIKGSLGIGYGIGPLTLKGVKFNGELYPLEDDPKVSAQLTGRITMPMYGELYGTFGAYIGAEVLLGAVGVKGGIEVKPSLRLNFEPFIKVDVAYEAGGFKSVAGEAGGTGTLVAGLKVDLMAEIYAAWGLFSHTWTYNVADTKKPIGGALTLSLGKVGWDKDAGITWPKLSDVKTVPEDLNPMEIVKELLGMGKSPERDEAKQALRDAGLGHML